MVFIEMCSYLILSVKFVNWYYSYPVRKLLRARGERRPEIRMSRYWKCYLIFTLVKNTFQRIGRVNLMIVWFLVHQLFTPTIFKPSYSWNERKYVRYRGVPNFGATTWDQHFVLEVVVEFKDFLEVVLEFRVFSWIVFWGCSYRLKKYLWHYNEKPQWVFV